MLSAVVAPTGLHVIPEPFLFYIKLAVEMWSSAARAMSDVEEAERVEKLWKVACTSWEAHAKHSSYKKVGAESSTAELKAAELLKDVSWEDIIRRPSTMTQTEVGNGSNILNYTTGGGLAGGISQGS